MTEQQTDWSLLDVEGVQSVIEAAAWKVARRYEFMEVTDLIQEGQIWVASRPDQVKSLIAEDTGLLHRWVWCRLTDHARKELRVRQRQVSYERVAELVDSQEYVQHKRRTVTPAHT